MSQVCPKGFARRRGALAALLAKVEVVWVVLVGAAISAMVF
jgi:hypothetical protein